MGNSSGEGFPNGGVNVGDEFYKISTKELFRYISGDPRVASSWEDTGENGIVAQLSSNVDQINADLNAHVVTYNMQDVLTGASHVIDDSKVYIDHNGTYFILVGGQIAKPSGGALHLLDLWIRLNGVDVANSNVRIGVSAAGAADVIVINYAGRLVAGDYIEVVQAVDNVIDSLGLYALTGLAGGPLVPSIILTIVRLSK